MSAPVLADRSRCTGCGACAAGCPKNAIIMVADREGFFYPSVGENCVQCGHCSHICPAMKQREERPESAVFAAWHRDETIRQRSGAGGAFTAIAEYVLEGGGIVFGAAVDEHMVVRHMAVRKREELAALRGPKPIQSQLGDTYKAVRRALAGNQTVLFTGTPCQVDGLYRFLGEHPANLLTCDVVCSGVASPGVWEKLVQSMTYIKRKAVVSVQFAHKLEGAKEGRFRVYFEGGGTYDAPVSKSQLGRGYLSRLLLRPACHTCPYANGNRVGDITLGTFRGLGADLAAEEQKGVSLLLVNSVKGAHLFDALPLHRVKRTMEEAKAHNDALCAPQRPAEERSDFFAALEEAGTSVRAVFERYLNAPNPIGAMAAKWKEKLWKKR